MKLIDAGIKSKRELIKRLMDGEVFYSTCGSKIYFDEKEIIPFRNGLGTMRDSFIRFESFKKEIRWEDDLDKGPIICFVGDTEEEINYRLSIMAIDGIFEDGRYVDVDTEFWKFATPVKPQDCWQGGENE